MQFSKIINTLICLLIGIQISYSQKIDSLLSLHAREKGDIEKYDLDFELAKIYTRQRQWKNADRYIDEALQISNSLQDKELIAKAYHLSGRAKLSKGAYQKADSLFEKALKYTTQKELKGKLYSSRFSTLIRVGNIERGLIYLQQMRGVIGDDTTSLLMGEYYFNYSNYYGEQANILKQLQYLQQSKKIFLQHGESVENLNYNLGAIFEELKDYENILTLQFETRKNAKRDKDPLAELFALFGIMIAQNGLKDYDAAKKTCFEAINLKSKKDVSEAFGHVYYILGGAHLQTNQLDSAEYYFNKGIKISALQNEPTQFGDNHAGMAALKFKQGKLRDARLHAEKARTSFNYLNSDNNTILAKIYAKEKNYKQAYQLLNINWSDAQRKEANRTDYKIIASLLNDKFEQEKIQEQALFQQELRDKWQILIAGILTISFLLLVSIIVIKTRNYKRLKNLNHKLTQQNNALQQFSYIASHDIKEPIRSVGNYIGLIKRKLSDENQKSLHLYFDNIKSSLQQTYTLIEDVMQYTQVIQDVTIKLSIVNLNTIVKNIEISLESFIQEKNGQIIYANLPNIKSNNSMLFMILKNLIQNGLKFNHSEVPMITITCETTSKNHILKVSDNGIGIDKEYHNKIFGMFKRLNTREHFQGSGIGLSIVELSVGKLNGKIELESEKGEKSQFIITIPK